VGECRSEVRVRASEVRVVGEGEALGLAPFNASAPTIGGGAHGLLGISSFLPCHLN
jgi:hypothetical protein